MPAITATATASAASGTHHGMPSGAIRVNESTAARATSMTTIGSSAATSVGALGLSAGADRRSAVIRTARPKLLLKRLPR